MRTVWTKVVLSVVVLIGSLTGAGLSALGLVAKDEPQFVLQLSWAALYIESFNTLQVALQDLRKKQDEAS